MRRKITAERSENMSKLIVETEGNAPESVKSLIRLAAKAAFAHFEYDWDGYVFIQLVDGETIRRINNEHRGIDKETDVLSFPMNDFYRGECREEIYTDPQLGACELGDMVISLSRAREQAREFGHSVARECAYLTVHSILHLLGFDHIDEGEEKAAMRQREEEILKKLGLERE
ncbi:MAG: rRNA maturation RNase YbeY [Clostridia bacterium]|nr:rRNA maturation RNase YbeY [Clostridia bacterium]